MKIIKTSLPNNSVLNTSQKNYDFSDSFESVFKDSQNIKTIKKKNSSSEFLIEFLLLGIYSIEI